MPRRLLALILIATFAYSAYWYVGSSAKETAIKSWLDDRRAAGWVAEYADLSVRGYPNRFDTRVIDLKLADPRSEWAWSAPVFQVLALSYQPNHVIAVWPPEQKISTPDQTITVTSGDMRASVKFEPDTALALSALTMDLTDIQMTSTADWTSRIAKAQLATRQSAAADFGHDVYFRAEKLKPARVLRLLIDPEGRLPDVFDTVTLDTTLTFDAAWDRHAIEGRKPEFRRIELRTVNAVWGQMEFQATGALDVDEAGYPSGEIAVRAKNWRDMLNIAVSAGAIPAELAGTLESGLDLLAGLTGNPDTIDAPLKFKNRVMLLGPIPIGPAPKIRVNP